MVLRNTGLVKNLIKKGMPFPRCSGSAPREGDVPKEHGAGEVTETGDCLKTVRGYNRAGGWRASARAGAPHTSPGEALVPEGKEQRSWQGLQREWPRLPSRRQEASGRHNRLRLICKKRGKQDFLFFPPKQKAKEIC